MTSVNINGTLIHDQTAGLQDNDFAISGDLTGLSADFRTYLLGLGGTLALSADQLAFANLVEAARTPLNYVTVSQNSASINDLFFSKADGTAFDGQQVIYDGNPLQTIGGDTIYFHSAMGGDVVIATTSATAGMGELVAAFYLNDAADNLSAGIEMVTFMPIAHPDATNPDDRIDWTDLLNVTATGTLSFNFDVLDSGKFLWAAIGDDQQGLLISGFSLDVDNNSKAVKNNSDFVNTSQGGLGATIGIDNQMFEAADPGDPPETAVVTLVEGFDPLSGGVGQAHSDYLIDTVKGGNTYEGVNYTGYIDVSSCKLFFSQDQGSGTFSARISLWEAGAGVGTPEQELNYIGAEPSGAFQDDTPIGVKSVTVYGNSGVPGVLGAPIATWGAGGVAFGTTVNGVTVTMPNPNDFIISGLDAFYTVGWAAVDGETFNRFRLNAESGKFDIGRLDIDQGLVVTEPVGDTLFVDDDFPALSGSNASRRVEEDELSTVAVAPFPADGSDGITDFDAFTDEATFTFASLAAVLSGGTDGVGSFALDTDGSINGAAVHDIAGNAMFSNGDAMTWNVNGSVVEAKAGGRVILTITHDDKGNSDPTDDEFHIDLRDQVDHPNASGDDFAVSLDLTPTFRAFDKDGDEADLNGADDTARPIRLAVENDVPEPNNQFILKHVDEDAMTGAGGGDLSTGIIETPADGDGIAGEQDEVTFTQADLQGVVNDGADELVFFGLNSSLVNGTAVKTIGGADVHSKGDQVYWMLQGGGVHGVTDMGLPSQRIIFSVTVNTQGNADPSDDVFTFDLKDQLDHSSGSGELALLTLNATPAFQAADFDGDAVLLASSTAIRVEVENDVPSITAQIQDGAVDFLLNDSVTKSLNGAVGADDNSATNQASDGTKTYTISGFSTPTNAFPDLTGVLSADATKVTYYTTSVAADQNASTAIYELSLNQTANSGAGSYTFKVLQPPPLVETEFGFADQPSGQNLFGIIGANKANISDTPPQENPNDRGDDFLPDGGLFFFNKGAVLGGDGAYISNQSSTVNTSKGGGQVSIGYGANNYTTLGHDCFFVFADNPSYNSVGGLGLTQTSADDADTAAFDGTIEVKSASVEIVKIVGSKEAGVTVIAYDLDPLGNGITMKTGGGLGDIDPRDLITNPLGISPGGAGNEAVQVDILGVKIYNSVTSVGDATLVFSAVDANNNGVFEAGEISVNTGEVVVEMLGGLGPNSVKVTGMDTNKDYSVRYDTASDHDMAEIQYVAGSYNIGGFNLIQGEDTPDQLFDFSVLVTDHDLDTDGGELDAFANFQVTVDGTGVFDDPLIGLAASAVEKNSTFVNDSGMVPSTASLYQPDQDLLLG